MIISQVNIDQTRSVPIDLQILRRIRVLAVGKIRVRSGVGMFFDRVGIAAGYLRVSSHICWGISSGIESHRVILGLRFRSVPIKLISAGSGTMILTYGNKKVMEEKQKKTGLFLK